MKKLNEDQILNYLIPELYVSNFTKSKQFYTGILGFTIEYKREKPSFAFMSFEGNYLMIQGQGNRWQTGILEYPYGRGINLQIMVKSLEPLLVSLQSHNYPLKQEVEDNCYQVKDKKYCYKEFLVMDPDGYLLRFSQCLNCDNSK